VSPCVCAVISGAEGWKDIEKYGHKKLAWLRKSRRFEQGIPVDDSDVPCPGNSCPRRIPASE
jgi:hypothetical protein